MLKATVVLLSLVGVALASITLASLEEKPEKFKGIEGCYIRELDAVIPFNEAAPSKQYCKEYRCWDRVVESVYCNPVEAADLPCYVARDETKPYPDCCSTVRCD